MGAEGKRAFCIKPDDVEKVGAVLKEAQYKAGTTYLAELKLMLIEDGGLWSRQHERMFARVSRALKRAKGPSKKSAEVPEDRWLESKTSRNQ